VDILTRKIRIAPIEFRLVIKTHLTTEIKRKSCCKLWTQSSA